VKKCPKCNKIHNKPGVYCSRHCANSRIWSVEDKKKKSKAALESEKIQKKRRFCKYCGAIKNECKRKDICSKHQIFPTLIKYFGFNKDVIGTEQLYEEFERIQNIFIEEYIINQLSTVELQKKYKCLNQRIVKVFKNFDINIRNLPEAISLAYTNNKLDRNKLANAHKSKGNPIYKSGWHTTWNNKKVFLRSSYELDFAQQLDLQQIDYEVEKLRILYWDSQLLKQRIAIPDFYILLTNTIVEIKSDYTLNEQNMKDKFKAYKEHGYKCKLILNKKEILYL